MRAEESGKVKAVFQDYEEGLNGGFTTLNRKLRPRLPNPDWAKDERSILMKMAMTPRIKDNIKIATKYFVEGWNCQDIAKDMGLSSGAVRSRLLHIRRIK
jgi:DNA-directed RNA polymerase specialized sigma24 family protein